MKPPPAPPRTGATIHWHAPPPTPAPMPIKSPRDRSEAPAAGEPSEALARPAGAPRVAPTIIDTELAADPPIKLKPHSRLPGTPFEILRWLGDGGMGVVLEARHVDLDRRVALKILRTIDAGPVVDLFRQEARALARLGSEYVVQVFDFVELRDGRLMIAMELVQGTMLSDVLESSPGGGTPMPLQRAIPILRQVCKGLAAAHGEGIVHRDIKPANIALVRRRGRDDAVKLLDFGVAQFAGHARVRAGTPGYLAPEIVADVGCDARSDIYAVGCLAYLMITGRPPFLHKEAADMLMAHLSETPAPPSRHADVPKELDAIVLRCLAKDPADRFARAEDLEAALCEAQIALKMQTTWDDLPLPDVDPELRDKLLRGMPEIVVPPRRRSWLPWALAGLAVAAALGLGARVLLEDSAPTASELAVVDELTHRARAAAARAFFVYPPPERPEEATAYTVVLQLEAQQDEVGPTAMQRATELRAEFADTLQRLGDEYWAADGGRPFALDYYAQVLVFDPERELAKERAAMTPGELRSLRQKAETGGFDRGELEAVEPLIVLAHTDDPENETRLERIEEDEVRAESTRARIDRLVRGGKKKPPSAKAVARTEAPTPAPVASLPPAAEPEPEPEPAALVPATAPVASKSDEADRDAARRLTKEGDAARKRGETRTAENLYAQALAADRRYAAAYAGLAAVQYDAGNYALAARTAEKAVRLAPRNADYRIQLGDAHYKTYQNAAARNQYQRAVELGHPAARQRLDKLAQRGG